jgi:AcrR family transcriptional regulator
LDSEEATADRRTAKRGVEVSVASQRRKQIIDAARDCISEEGVDKLTLRKVAERAHVSHATIAYYFNSRRELIDSALLEISEDFMVGLRQRQLAYGTRDLIDLTDRFLDPENPSARFIVQMIDAGLKDAELRPTHDEFIGYGRERIEKSIRVGMQMGELRDDVDPRVAAALLHTVLIWWQTELAAEATTRDLALEVGGLVLDLLQPLPAGGKAAGSARAPASRNGHRLATGTLPTTIDLIESSLLNDPRLSRKAATTLAETFRKLYEWAADGSHTESG